MCRSRTPSILYSLALLCGLAATAAAQGGPAAAADWIPTFGPQTTSGFSFGDFVTFDDGTGPALYLAGDFNVITGKLASDLVRFDGTSWTPVGDDLTPSAVNGRFEAVAVFDDGSGPALYAAGAKSVVDGQLVRHIARWDGVAWSGVGGGFDSTVRALAVYDDGSGPALYAGGEFTMAGGAPASHFARWDGQTWSEVGGGTDFAVYTLHAFDLGDGRALYAGGEFHTAGGVTVNGIARWDGTAFSALGVGVSPGATVFDLEVYDDGTGLGLYACGAFTTAGGALARHIARWDGAAWSQVGGGVVGGYVRALQVFDDGEGPVLFAGGDFAFVGGPGGASLGGLVRWDGMNWSAPGAGITGGWGALAVFDPGTGPRLWVAGAGSSGEALLGTLASWDGTRWLPVGDQGLIGGLVYDVAIFDDGTGPALYAGGTFTTASGKPAQRVAKWDGSRWSPLGAGLVGTSARALEAFDDGSGPALYVAGSFSTAGEVSASSIASWDGTGWRAVGAGLTFVRDLIVFDDGSGPALYAAAGGLQRWDGAQWLPPGGGVAGNVNAMVVYDDGTGPALYLATFNPMGGAVDIIRWDGTRYTSLGSNPENSVLALTVHDDGTGPVLVAAGSFESIGGVSAQRVAAWDGNSWSALGGGIEGGNVLTLASYDDGTGPALFAGGSFGSVEGGVTAKRVARFDGSRWMPMGDGMAMDIGDVQALLVSELPEVGGLIVAGGFIASDPGDSRMARWAPPESLWVDLGGGTTGSAGPPALTMSGGLTPGSTVSLDLVDGAPSALAAVFLSLASTPAPFLGGTLHAYPVDALVLAGTAADGRLQLSATFPGAATGQGFWFQVGVVDPTVAVHGASLSNGVLGTVR